MRKAGKILMTLGVVLIAAALALFASNQQESTQAETSSLVLLEQVQNLTAGNEEVQLPEGEVDGRMCMGRLEIPALELQLPILSDWSYEALRVAPCRYVGAMETDDLVLMAHNYDSHFGRLNTLQQGDEILLTDMSGEVHRYRVCTVEVLAPEAVEEMTAGEYDLTLFTCTYGGKSRVTVRCDRAYGES